MEERLQSQSLTRPKRFYILLLIIIALAGYFLGKFIPSGKPILIVPSPTPAIQANQLFRSQTATFQGEIIKVNEDSLDVKTDAGMTGNFKLSDKVYIYKFKAGASQATSSTDLKTIETGKRVLIILELSANQYKVVSISFQPVPTPPPAGGKTPKK